ncbi:LysE family translocator [Ramlibacter sp.]|uniref:LysE family translocator n=1 Tax=Ramlibacter sp. TaxID=1917967 RepID=UPI001834C6AE|nr:LysE family translocator [Ramlibacter sp.]MBA2672103.1 LysE family translocator [Ramlibacter sp.]
MDASSLAAFSITTAVSCFTPGPAAVFVMSNAASYGRTYIFPCVAGIIVANLVYFLLAAAGLANLITHYPGVYQGIRIAGAAYLVYLGGRLFLASGGAGEGANALAMKLVGPRASRFQSSLKSFAIEISNPKAILYFGALLPQFMQPGESLYHQILVFAAITVMLDIMAYTFYGGVGYASSRMAGPRLMRGITRLAGLVLLAVGLKLLFKL